MVVYDISYGESLGINGIKKERTFHSLRKLKDFLHLFSGCSDNDIDEYEGDKNMWFGNYLVEVKWWVK